MLEITIFKTRHSGAEEAKKLKLHVPLFDVFSIEIPAITASKARAIERLWAQMLEDRVSIDLEDNPPRNPSELYSKIIETFMLESNKPRYCAERFAFQGSIDFLFETRDAGLALCAAARMQYTRGKLDAAISLYYEGRKQLEDAMELRDKNIASNLEDAEITLKHTHPALKDKPCILLGLQLGAGHHVEDYLPVTPTIVTLVGNVPSADELLFELDYKIRRGTPKNDVSMLIEELLQTTSTQ